MPRQSREERTAHSSATGRRWAALLRAGMEAAGITPSQLAERATEHLEPGRAFDKSNVSHWLAGKYGADPDRAVAIATVLGQDAIEYLRGAGHEGLARFAERMRADTAAAIVEQELAAIDDDPYLDRLDRWAERGIITRAERDRRRSEYLDDKKRDIQEIPQIYTAELDRLQAEAAQDNGDTERAAL